MAAAEYLTAREVAGLLNVSTRTVSRWLRDGIIPSTKMGRQHRIPRASIPVSGQPERTWDAFVEVSMNYPGKVISKNHSHRGGYRGTPEREATDWKAALAESIRMSFLAKGAKSISLPVSIEVHCRFVNEREAIDPHNCTELVADAVEKATGVNDRNYKVTSYPPTYNPETTPEILVTVTARCSA